MCITCVTLPLIVSTCRQRLNSPRQPWSLWVHSSIMFRSVCICAWFVFAMLFCSCFSSYFILLWNNLSLVKFIFVHSLNKPFLLKNPFKEKNFHLGLSPFAFTQCHFVTLFMVQPVCSCILLPTSVYSHDTATHWDYCTLHLA